jgi:hypothetical protein
MLSKPMYHCGNYVTFRVTAEEKVGKIDIVDAYGTFEQAEEPSYDIFVEKENCIYKHIRESAVIGIKELSYKNYNGTMEYSWEDQCLFGKVTGIQSLKGQFIFSTHNVLHLDLKNYMKEQIYFITKDRDSLTSELYSLADFPEVRYETTKVYEFYMKGILGGTAFELPKHP